VPEDFFDAGGTVERLAAEALVVDLDGFEGPLDLLLTLARSQKVDLRRISILRLAEQYLGFVEAAKRLNNAFCQLQAVPKESVPTHQVISLSLPPNGCCFPGRSQSG
jgi:hypothetical protein